VSTERRRFRKSTPSMTTYPTFDVPASSWRLLSTTALATAVGLLERAARGRENLVRLILDASEGVGDGGESAASTCGRASAHPRVRASA
jgi:hypothetical protein